MRAYVLVTTELGRAAEVATRLRPIELDGGRVIAAEAVTGSFDVVAVAEVKDWDSLGFVITHGIEPVEGVEKVEACISLKCPTRDRPVEARAA